MTLKTAALTCGKLLLLAYVAAMAASQLPELRYDLGPKTPVRIASPADLAAARGTGSTFAAIHGRGDFTKAAVFAKHGVRFSYFLLEGYGPGLVVRTPDPVTDDWRQLDCHVGRLRSFRRMPFSRSVRAGFGQLHGVVIPADALYLARDDVPRLSGWNVGAEVLAATLWFGLAYAFFIYPWRKRHRASSASG